MATSSLEAKIVVLGSQNVGKTSLVHRYVKNTFLEPSANPSTVGASFLTKRVVDVDSSTVVRLQIWDTAGQERFRSISKLYYRGANAALLCYDITDAKSFDEMGRWLRELKGAGGVGDDVVLHVVGTKSDLVAQDPTKRQVPFERCIAYVADHLYPAQSSPLPSSSATTTAWGSAGASHNNNNNNNSNHHHNNNYNGGMASPQSNRSSGFWGQDVGWDCCHEISAKDGEGVEEVFRVISRKLVDQRNQQLEREERFLAQQGLSPDLLYRRPGASANGYFDFASPDPNASFRVGAGDKRRSWLGFPTTPIMPGPPGANPSDPYANELQSDIDRMRKKRGGKCC